MNISNLTLAQLRAATKAQIITAIVNRLQDMTKRQIIIWLLDEVDRITDNPVRVHRPDGQIESQTDVERDTETGAKTGSRVVTWTYYPTGEVDEITITNKDAADKTIGKPKVIKHFTDGRQPEVTE